MTPEEIEEKFHDSEMFFWQLKIDSIKNSLVAVSATLHDFAVRDHAEQSEAAQQIIAECKSLYAQLQKDLAKCLTQQPQSQQQQQAQQQNHPQQLLQDTLQKPQG